MEIVIKYVEVKEKRSEASKNANKLKKVGNS